MNEARLEALTERLLRAGVASRHARRAVQELRAHHADVMAELRAAGIPPAQSEGLAAERVGPDEAFVREMLARPELRSWASRRPFVAFTLLPLLAFIALSALSVGSLIAVLEAARHWRAWLSPALIEGARGLCAALFFGAMWLAPLAAAAVTCLLAARQRIAARWVIAGVFLVGLLRAMINGSFDVPTSLHGSVSMGIGWAPHRLPETAVRAAIFIAPVLLPYLWWLRSHRVLTVRPRV